MTITIRVNKTEIHTAAFEPVRKVGMLTIGWATVEGIRFPAIIDGRFADRVYTVSDWQAPSSSFAEDLADPVQVAEMMECGAGQFLTPAGNRTSAAVVFARA